MVYAAKVGKRRLTFFVSGYLWNRSLVMTDVEIFWLVKGDAKDSEVDVERMMELWDVTYREDLWIVENNQHGIRNSRYNHAGGQPYSRREGGPAGFLKWYMTEIAPHA